MKPLLLATLLLLTPPAAAQDEGSVVGDVVDRHILSGFDTLATAARTLADTADADCVPTSPQLRADFSNVFDAWLGVSHLRFGPAETENRAFALAFWPDPRGATQRALAAMIAAGDPAVTSPEAFADVSVAARGLYALEMTLYDQQLAASDPDYLCSLARAQARDIAATAAAIYADWRDSYGDLLRNPGNETYRTEAEALQELYTALGTGLQFTSDTRLGLPLGTIERANPNLAEARRSGRSLRHVVLSLTALRDLGGLLAAGSPEAAATLDDAFAEALEEAEALDDPVFAGVSDPQGRLRVEILQQAIDRIRITGAAQLGPALGVAQGFNAMDGD